MKCLSGLFHFSLVTGLERFEFGEDALLQIVGEGVEADVLEEKGHDLEVDVLAVGGAEEGKIFLKPLFGLRFVNLPHDLLEYHQARFAVAVHQPAPVSHQPLPAEHPHQARVRLHQALRHDQRSVDFVVGIVAREGLEEIGGDAVVLYFGEGGGAEGGPEAVEEVGEEGVELGFQNRKRNYFGVLGVGE